MAHTAVAGDPFGFAQGRLFAPPEERLRSGRRHPRANMPSEVQTDPLSPSGKAASLLRRMVVWMIPREVVTNGWRSLGRCLR